MTILGFKIFSSKVPSPPFPSEHEMPHTLADTDKELVQ